MTTHLAVLVIGATGQQGGAAVRHIAARGHRVRALVRTPASPKAQALASGGVEVVPGDLDDPESVARALSGMDAVFLMTTPFAEGVDAEARQGIAAVDAAQAAGAFVVFASVANADRRTGIPHFESKFAVEEHIRARGVAATILAPAYFMENLWFALPHLRQGVYGSALMPSRPLMQVSVEDIGAAAASVIDNTSQHIGQRYDLAGDDITPEEEAAILSTVTGRSIRYVRLPIDVIRQAMGEDGVTMYRWFEDPGYSIDRNALGRAFPDVPWLSFRRWAERQNWAALLAG